VRYPSQEQEHAGLFLSWNLTRMGGQVRKQGKEAGGGPTHSDRLPIRYFLPSVRLGATYNSSPRGGFLVPGQTRNHQLEERVGLLLHRLGLQAAQWVQSNGHR